MIKIFLFLIYFKVSGNVGPWVLTGIHGPNIPPPLWKFGRGGPKLPSGVIPIIGGNTSNEQRLLHTTFIPEDFQEWYFICASFNPTIDEDGSYELSDYNTNTGALSHNTNFWMNNFIPDAAGTFTTAVGVVGNLVANSDYGNRCKVEIISRTDLLRARGYKV